MDQSIPLSAVKLLDFIASFEAPRGYDTIFGNRQNLLPQRITSMTVDAVLTSQPTWSSRFGSSAAGRYQFMRTTLAGLKSELGLLGNEIFDSHLQDRLAYRLLIRRGFPGYVAGRISLEGFALNLAKEWASLPVLRSTRGAHKIVARGQSYYAGDTLNKALVVPERVETVLREVNAAGNQENRPVTKPEAPASEDQISGSTGAATMNPDSVAKPWYLSKGVIGGLIAVTLPILSIFFPAARLANPETVTDWVMKITQIVGPVIGGLVAVYGRVRASEPIRGTDAAAKAETFLGGGNSQPDIGAAIGPVLQGFLLQIGQTVQQGIADGFKAGPPTDRKTGP